MDEAGIEKPDAIAYTAGPGLVGALMVGALHTPDKGLRSLSRETGRRDIVHGFASWCASVIGSGLAERLGGLMFA
jgi:hypothetical protein